MHQDCPECQALWRRYASATARHIELNNQLQLAIQQREAAVIEKVTQEVAEAALVRGAVRDALKDHETAAHGDVARTAEAGDA